MEFAAHGGPEAATPSLPPPQALPQVFSKRGSHAGCPDAAYLLLVSQQAAERASVTVSDTSSSANSEVNAQILSSCPYARIMLLSNPMSRAFPEGTISSSAERKSSSSMPYDSERILRIFAFSASFSSFSRSSLCSIGWFPIRGQDSPL